MDFQFYWSNWWKIIPHINIIPADEYGPKTIYICWSVFQFWKYL